MSIETSPLMAGRSDMQSRRQQNLDECRASCQRIRNAVGPAIWLYVAGAAVWLGIGITIYHLWN
jgi:hypothetical protein